MPYRTSYVSFVVMSVFRVYLVVYMGKGGILPTDLNVLKFYIWCTSLFAFLGWVTGQFLAWLQQSRKISDTFPLDEG